MEANPPVPQPTSRRQKVYRARWAIWGAALGIGVAIGAMVALSHKHSSTSADDSAVSTWPAGARPAPAFTLTDEHGKSFTLASLHGRSAIVTFIDPLCRDFCPTEAQHLNTVVRSFPASSKPAVVAVSVNTAGNTRPILREDGKKWGLVPQWRWGVGTPTALARIWHAYGIAVLVSTQKIAGVKVRKVAHTEASYVIDPNGFVRALFVWPYSAKGVVSTLRSLPS